jgi:hypothetical protein
VALDCTGATVLGDLAPFATFECFGLGLIGGARDENGQVPFFLSPLSSLPALAAPLQTEVMVVCNLPPHYRSSK